MISGGPAIGRDRAWILQAFESRDLPLPSLHQIDEWIYSAPTDAALLETVYGALKATSVGRDIVLLGIDSGRLTEDDLKALAGRLSGDIVGTSSPQALEKLKEALSALLYDKVGGESDPVIRFTLLTRDPWRLFAMALSGLPPEKLRTSGNLDRPIALGVERMMKDHGDRLSRKEILESFRKSRAFLREEKKRIRLEAERERQRERDFHEWVRSLWSDIEVRRELGLRPSEFEEWVEGGRIPVVLRIESIRNGRIRERRLFDPDRPENNPGHHRTMEAGSDAKGRERGADSSQEAPPVPTGEGSGAPSPSRARLIISDGS